MILTLVQYILTAARRDKLFLSLLCILIVGSSLSIFLSSAAVIEQAQFSIVYMAGSLRILGLVGLSLFVIFFIRRSFEARDIEFLLTRPVSRQKFVVSHTIAFTILAVLASLVLALGLTYATYGIGNTKGIICWSLGVVFEYIIIVNVSFFFAMVLASPVAASLSTLGFYILSRLMGQLLFIAKHPPEEMPIYSLLSGLFKMISMLIPRIDLMAQTSWLLYGTQQAQDYLFIIGQAVVFLFLVLAATLVDLTRRQF